MSKKARKILVLDTVNDKNIPSIANNLPDFIRFVCRNRKKQYANSIVIHIDNRAYMNRIKNYLHNTQSSKKHKYDLDYRSFVWSIGVSPMGSVSNELETTAWDNNATPQILDGDALSHLFPPTHYEAAYPE